MSASQLCFGSTGLAVSAAISSCTNSARCVLRMTSTAIAFLIKIGFRNLARWCGLSRLDELPQLYNILVGEMSFVGPRPLLVTDHEPGTQDRLLVRPGLTGWAQVNGGRKLAPEDKAALDIWYVAHLSLTLDFKIALRTVASFVFWGTHQSRRRCVRRTHFVPTRRSPAACDTHRFTTGGSGGYGAIRCLAVVAQLLSAFYISD